MNKRFKILLNNISLFAFIGIYLIIAITLLFLESFQVETQLNVITALLPFFLIGAILDFMVKRNKQLTPLNKLIVQLLPTGIFVLFGISALYNAVGQAPLDAFNYIVWLFIALPFFMTSNFKDNHKMRLIFSLIGIGLLGSVYLYLTTLTNELNQGNGLLVYMIYFFLLYYAASGFKNLSFIGGILGAIDALILIFIWINPITENAKVYGWDYDIAFNFELLMLFTLIISIAICFLDVLTRAQSRKIN